MKGRKGMGFGEESKKGREGKREQGEGGIGKKMERRGKIDDMERKGKELKGWGKSKGRKREGRKGIRRQGKTR